MGKDMVKILYGGAKDEASAWVDALSALRPNLKVFVDPQTPAEQVDMLLYAPGGAIEDLSPFTHCRAIQSLWAGVEGILANPTLPDGPALCRMVDQGLTLAMTDYVVGHVLRAHLGMDQQRTAQALGTWEETHPPLSPERTVGVVGLGALGRDAAEMLVRLRFNVLGWSRTHKQIEGVTCFSGEDGLSELLSAAEIIVLLLPHTSATENLFDAPRIAAMRDAAHLINAARGALIDDTALLAALDRGKLASATLDVFRDEPLPANHPYWRHPRVTVTPHIASTTRPKWAAKTVIEQIGRLERGEPLLYQVDRKRGY